MYCVCHPGDFEMLYVMDLYEVLRDNKGLNNILTKSSYRFLKIHFVNKKIKTNDLVKCIFLITQRINISTSLLSVSLFHACDNMQMKLYGNGIFSILCVSILYSIRDDCKYFRRFTWGNSMKKICLNNKDEIIDLFSWNGNLLYMS